MEKERIFVEAKNQKGNLHIIKHELLQTLNLPETGILREKEAREYVFFSKEKWERFAKHMRGNKWKTVKDMEKALDRITAMSNFERDLSAKGGLADVKGNVLNIIRCGMKTRIPEGISRVEICVNKEIAKPFLGESCDEKIEV